MPSDASSQAASGFSLSFGPREVSAAIAVLSALTLATALSLEHFGGFQPCHLCLEERVAHYAAVPAAVLAFLLARLMPPASRIILALIALAFVYNAVLSAYHVGVEYHWWEGPSSCTGVGSIASTPAELLKSLQSGGNVVIRCDEVPLWIFGFSLAFYGALLSAFMAVLAGLAALGIPRRGLALT